MKNLSAVLFDLDGTLIDTAPDMAAAINQVLVEHQKEPLSIEQIRPYVSKGSPGLIQLTFGMSPNDEIYEKLKERFLAIYQESISIHSTLFPGAQELLVWLESIGIPWGIVTNKPEYLTQQLLKNLNLLDRAAVVTSGDTFPEKKPHPLPLLESCKIINVDAKKCIYVGDDERDIIAGNAANMTTIAANWGYIPIGEQTTEWNSALIANNVNELTAQIKSISTKDKVKSNQ